MNHSESTDAVELVLDRVTRRYAGSARDGRPALDTITLEVKRGEIVALVGPSGCGKSTTLRLVAGLDDPDEGEISLGGRSLRGVAPQDRDVAMVFQGYALYPHMTARQIMEFPLRMRGAPKSERDDAVTKAASMLGLGKLLDRRPDQMSGGERQRVAMGRAIVRNPKVFLFDEPLSNLDPSLREDIRTEIGSLVRKLGATALYVTHDHLEAMTLADRIAVMNAGRLLQCAPPREVYEHPATRFVATFVGTPRMNLAEATRDGDTMRAGPFAFPAPKDAPGKLTVGVRPEDVRVGAEGVPATVTSVEPHGPETLLTLTAGDIVWRAILPGFSELSPGASVRLAVDPLRVHCFDPARDDARVSAS